MKLNQASKLNRRLNLALNQNQFKVKIDHLKKLPQIQILKSVDQLTASNQKEPSKALFGFLNLVSKKAKKINKKRITSLTLFIIPYNPKPRVEQNQCVIPAREPESRVKQG